MKDARGIEIVVGSPAVAGTLSYKRASTRFGHVEKVGPQKVTIRLLDGGTSSVWPSSLVMVSGFPQ
jgi:hypothetical protein